MNPLILKISKILALAADQDGTPEGDMAARLAAKMMREHAISMAEVRTVSAAEADPMTMSIIQAGRSTWRAELVWILARHCNCTALRQGNKKHPGQIGGSMLAWMKVYGHKVDVEVCQYLYEICERQVEQAAVAWKKARGGARYAEGQRYRESVVYGLKARLEEIRAAGQAEDPNGTALVLSRAQQANSYMHSLTTPSKKGYGGGHKMLDRDGYEAGKKIKLHAGVGEDEHEELEDHSSPV